MGASGSYRVAPAPEQEIASHHMGTLRPSLDRVDTSLQLHPPCHTDLNGGEVFIELRVQRRQLVHRAIEDAVVVPEQLAQEEGREGHVHHNSLREGR